MKAVRQKNYIYSNAGNYAKISYNKSKPRYIAKKIRRNFKRI